MSSATIYYNFHHLMLGFIGCLNLRYKLVLVTDVQSALPSFIVPEYTFIFYLIRHTLSDIKEMLQISFSSELNWSGGGSLNIHLWDLWLLLEIKAKLYFVFLKSFTALCILQLHISQPGGDGVVDLQLFHSTDCWLRCTKLMDSSHQPVLTSLRSQLY